MKVKVIQAIEAIFNQKRTLSAIVRECGCSVEYVRQIGKDLGYQQPDRRLRTA